MRRRGARRPEKRAGSPGRRRFPVPRVEKGGPWAALFFVDRDPAEACPVAERPCRVRAPLFAVGAPLLRLLPTSARGFGFCRHVHDASHTVAGRTRRGRIRRITLRGPLQEAAPRGGQAPPLTPR